MEIKPKQSFEDKFPTATVKFLVGSEEVKNHLLQTLGELEASEELRIRNEEVRDAHEQGRIRNEDERQEKELQRSAAESNRVLAEKVRNEAEQKRMVAEESHAMAEGGRVIAEQKREAAEDSREVAEQARVGREQQRETGEELRIRNEEIRDAHEQGRIRNEDERQEKELQRSAAESSRVLAEEARVLAEQRRVDAEQERADNDVLRGELLQEHERKINEHTKSIENIESDVKDLGDAPRSEVDNSRYSTIRLMDRESKRYVYPITIPEAVIDKDGNNVLDIIKRYWSEGNTESDVMYGVEWDVTVADPAMTRIGNMALHRQLPIHNRVKGCLLDDDGNVVEYLNPTTWLGATRDGSRGQVMVEIPDHYRKFETDGNIRRAKISEYPLPGYHYVPKMYISAYEATVQRSTNMLCSVVNSDPDYRGGDNTAAWDGTYRSLLGCPATDLNTPTFRSYARNRKKESTEWNLLTYDAYKALFWLYYIEYANRNCQLPFNAEKDSNGFSQGGLGDGATTLTYGETGRINSYNPIIQCGYTDSLGNSSGTIPFDVTFADGSTKRIYANRYRGIENPFGHISKWVDGLLVVITAGESASAYIAEDPAYFNDTNISGYRYAGNEPLSGDAQGKDIIFGEHGDICCSELGGSTTTYWCDRHQAPSSSAVSGTMVTRWGGALQGGWGCGLAFEYTYFVPSYKGTDSGTRLCFIPKNNE